jgi:hypothetical protein
MYSRATGRDTSWLDFDARDETLSRSGVSLVEVLVPALWQQRTNEHRRNDRQEKCQVIPRGKFAPIGDVPRREHCFRSYLNEVQSVASGNLEPVQQFAKA